MTAPPDPGRRLFFGRRAACLYDGAAAAMGFCNAELRDTGSLENISHSPFRKSLIYGTLIVHAGFDGSSFPRLLGSGRKDMKTGNRNSRAGRIIGDILLALAVLLIADVAFVMPARINAVVLKADYRKVFIYEIVLCAVLLVFALDVRFNLFTRWKNAILRAVGRLLRTVVVLMSAVIVFFCGKVIVGGVINTADRADYAIVLGLALENGEPAPDLLARLDTAREYLKRYPEAHLILTGGNADESGRTEAAVMRDILTERGVPEDRLILEDQAQTTKENFRNISGIVSMEGPVVMISSDYHMDRAVRNASESGFSHVMRLPAPSGFLSYGANMLSEVVLDLNDLIK